MSASHAWWQFRTASRHAEHALLDVRPYPKTSWLFIAAFLFAVAGCRGRQADVASPSDDVSQSATSNQVAYVGDESCAECHEEITARFRTHSMGQSLATIERASPVESFEPDARSTFEAGGFRYEVIQKEGELIHRQSRLAADGQELAVIEQPVHYAVGSGHHGRSYLVDRDGYLFMSPVTWYPDKGIWDLSPGFEKNNSQFNRPIIDTCLFCHSNRALRVPHTANRYSQPPFEGYAIGCERCHGPGERHVQLHQGDDAVAEGDEQWIVNPAKLAPERREAVCQQCHLAGVARVLKPGRSLYDFRPGQPLESCFTIFVLRPDLVTGDRFVGQVEQMYASRCFQASDGQLGCISCHDPHQLPAPEERIEYYRERCLQCHAAQGCSLDEAERRRTQPDDSCMQCHMPRHTTEVRHASMVDHRIPRTAIVEESKTDVSPGPGSLPVVPFSGIAKPEAPIDRDAAIAVYIASSSHSDLIEPRHLQLVIPVLERAARDNVEDLDVHEFLGQAYLAAGRTQEAFDTFQHVLQRQPSREVSLAVVADLLNSAGEPGMAVDYWRRAMRVNPWMSRYWFGLARAYQGSGQWQLCRDTAQEATTRFPTSIGARQLLIESYLQLDQQEDAREAFRWLEQYRPRGMDALTRWYEAHPQRR